jgi:hypothetical protein
LKSVTGRTGRRWTVADLRATLDCMTLREQVEALLPNWETWYPSLFDAARDLGVIRARVCDPGSLLLSNRHAGVTSEAVRMHRERWSIEEEETPAGPGRRRRKRR